MRDVSSDVCHRQFSRPCDLARHKCLTERSLPIQDQRVLYSVAIVSAGFGVRVAELFIPVLLGAVSSLQHILRHNVCPVRVDFSALSVIASSPAVAGCPGTNVCVQSGALLPSGLTLHLSVVADASSAESKTCRDISDFVSDSLFFSSRGLCDL